MIYASKCPGEGSKLISLNSIVLRRFVLTVNFNERCLKFSREKTTRKSCLQVSENSSPSAHFSLSQVASFSLPLFRHVKVSCQRLRNYMLQFSGIRHKHCEPFPANEKYLNFSFAPRKFATSCACNDAR